MVWRKKDNPRTAGPVDKSIGHRIRARRLALGMSQEALATEIGITFQQVQKYEKGMNRVAAATLVDIARALDAPVTLLLPAMTTSPATSLIEEPGAAELIPLLKRLNPDGRRVLSLLARALAKEPLLASSKADEED
jgi:transcriptional regulator with XRE-family HTH domain